MTCLQWVVRKALFPTKLTALKGSLDSLVKYRLQTAVTLQKILTSLAFDTDVARTRNMIFTGAYTDNRSLIILVPRPVRAIRVNRGGLEPSAIANFPDKLDR